MAAFKDTSFYMFQYILWAFPYMYFVYNSFHIRHHDPRSSNGLLRWNTLYNANVRLLGLSDMCKGICYMETGASCCHYIENKILYSKDQLETINKLHWKTSVFQCNLNKGQRTEYSVHIFLFIFFMISWFKITLSTMNYGNHINSFVLVNCSNGYLQ